MGETQHNVVDIFLAVFFVTLLLLGLFKMLWRLRIYLSKKGQFVDEKMLVMSGKTPLRKISINLLEYLFRMVKFKKDTNCLLTNQITKDLSFLYFGSFLLTEMIITVSSWKRASQISLSLVSGIVLIYLPNSLI